MSLLNFNYYMIYIIHKILVLLKNHLNYLKDSIFECFHKEYNRLFVKYFFTYVDVKFKFKIQKSF